MSPTSSTPNRDPVPAQEPNPDGPLADGYYTTTDDEFLISIGCRIPERNEAYLRSIGVQLPERKEGMTSADVLMAVGIRKWMIKGCGGDGVAFEDDDEDKEIPRDRVDSRDGDDEKEESEEGDSGESDKAQNKKDGENDDVEDGSWTEGSGWVTSSDDTDDGYLADNETKPKRKARTRRNTESSSPTKSLPTPVPTLPPHSTPTHCTRSTHRCWVKTTCWTICILWGLMVVQRLMPNTILGRVIGFYGRRVEGEMRTHGDVMKVVLWMAGWR
ncbi:hypothetical protein P154DRAFT_538595 [Amniculicola lignicola CBS 123094]|uniref:Uncharacterized protein n=1 Tax=Amniculicola lignicola CBS 123094 TaxID=1392246 RepID=A0A6A5W1D7_9PLEO|nr:hypothetical protein P154DRAFT_538595 [Amniculicola lignicola CBS 123094]